VTSLCNKCGRQINAAYLCPWCDARRRMIRESLTIGPRDLLTLLLLAALFLVPILWSPR
jgi:hypothetical protein